MKTCLATLMLVLVACMATACSLVSEESAVRKALDTQIQYLNSQNIDGYMTTLASEAPSRAATENFLRQTAAYNLRYGLESVNVLNIQNGRAVVRVVQTTRATSPAPGLPPFQNNRATIEHTLIKESTGWKILSSTAVNSQPI